MPEPRQDELDPWLLAMNERLQDIVGMTRRVVSQKTIYWRALQNIAAADAASPDALRQIAREALDAEPPSE